MTILKKDRVERFRDRLYQKKMPRLFCIGTSDLNPIKRSRTDEQGKTIIATKEIILFFQSSVQDDTFFDADQYFSNLYLLFSVLTKDTDQFTFESDVQISVEDINEASNKKAIEYLTTNLIISFFDHAHLSDGSDNDAFLEKGLKKLIAKTNEGRDYRALVGNTLQTMVKTLQEDKPWRESLDDIQTASLVCRLVGAKLPQIEKSVLAKNVLQARAEIENSLAVFNKILNTRKQLIDEESNPKIYLQTMKKLDAATSGVLKKIDTFLGFAHTFISAIGASSQGFLGPSDTVLKKCITRFFFEFDQTESGRNTALNYSTARYRMKTLLNYPELIWFTRNLKQEKTYSVCLEQLFSLFFNEIIKQLSRLSRTGHPDFQPLESCLNETLRLMDTFGLDKDQMQPEKKDIKKRFLSLVRRTAHEHLAPVLDLKDYIIQVTQDGTKELLEDTRRVLIDNCYSRLLAVDIQSMAIVDLHKIVSRLITGYSQFYKPHRFFFQNFFTTFVGETDAPLNENFSGIIQSKKMLAISMLTFFSDDNHVGGLLSKKQIEYADEVLESLYDKK